MKKLLSTTALVVALGLPTLSLAQSAAPAANSAAQDQNAGQHGFLAERSQSDLYASELMGHEVHARRVSVENDATDGQAAMNADETHDMTTMNRADLDEMDNIGEINEIVLSNDGQVRALVIGVGGFLGMGERNIAVTMDQVTFASDTDDRSQLYIVVNTDAEMLKDAPAYDLSAARAGRDDQDEVVRTSGTERTDAAEGIDETRAERTAFVAPDVERDGYDRVEVRDVSTEMLMGKTVYDVNDNDVGTVEDMILSEEGGITNVIIDFGGFLGIGSSQASLSFDELTILTTEGYEEVRLYVDATKAQIQDLPRYMASN